MRTVSQCGAMWGNVRQYEILCELVSAEMFVACNVQKKMCVCWPFSQLCVSGTNLSDYGMGVQMSTLTLKETRR